MPATMNEMTIAGPALRCACWPVSTKMPVPITTPTPKKVRSQAESSLLELVLRLVGLLDRAFHGLGAEEVHGLHPVVDGWVAQPRQVLSACARTGPRRSRTARMPRSRCATQRQQIGPVGLVAYGLERVVEAAGLVRVVRERGPAEQHADDADRGALADVPDPSEQQHGRSRWIRSWPAPSRSCVKLSLSPRCTCRDGDDQDRDRRSPRRGSGRPVPTAGRAVRPSPLASWLLPPPEPPAVRAAENPIGGVDDGAAEGGETLDRPLLVVGLGPMTPRSRS